MTDNPIKRNRHLGAIIRSTEAGILEQIFGPITPAPKQTRPVKPHGQKEGNRHGNRR